MSKTKMSGEDGRLLAAASGSAILDALALVDAGPRVTKHWIELAVEMCQHCLPGENVDQAAARILAAEVRRLSQNDRAQQQPPAANEKGEGNAQ